MSEYIGEPKSWNGDEDDRDGGFINRRTGHRRTEEDMVWTRTSRRVCENCGNDVITLYELPGVGVACSVACMGRLSERHAAAMDPRRI